MRSGDEGLQKKRWNLPKARLESGERIIKSSACNFLEPENRSEIRLDGLEFSA